MIVNTLQAHLAMTVMLDRVFPNNSSLADCIMWSIDRHAEVGRHAARMSAHGWPDALRLWYELAAFQTSAMSVQVRLNTVVPNLAA